MYTPRRMIERERRLCSAAARTHFVGWANEKASQLFPDHIYWGYRRTVGPIVGIRCMAARRL